MSPQLLRTVGAAVLVAVAMARSAVGVWAGEPPKVLPADGASPAAKPDEAAPEKEKVIREQSIYIPYEKLRKVFEREGRGVFLPYQEFRELWDAAREKARADEPAKPPVPALITEVDNEATVAKDVVQVRADVKIELLAEGWLEVPLALGDAAITSAQIAGQPARIIADGNGYKLLVEKKGKKPEPLELKLEYAKAIQRMPGQNSVAFQAPQAPVSRWKVRIPESGVKVNLSPLIAATEVTATEEGAKPGEPDQKPAGKPDEKPAAKKAEETVVLAFVGAAPSVRIDWTPKAEARTGLEALASVQTDQQVSLVEGVMRTRAQFSYAISRAQLGQLTLEVPADQKVVNVFDANVRQWTVAQAEEKQTISVQLFEPAKAAQSVTVELEKFFGDRKKDEPLSVPSIKAVGVGRQQGVVVVQVSEGLRAEAAKTSGLIQIDAAELPDSLKRGAWAFAYRYVSVPFELALSLTKVQPRILADTLVEAELTPEAIQLDVLNVYTIERSGVFRLEMDVPGGFEVRQVHGIDAAGAAAVQVDTHHVEGDKQPRLIVDLGRKAIGKVALAVQLRRELHEADLLAPTGKAADVPLPIPRVVQSPGVERATGRLVVYAGKNLQVNLKSTGLRAISTAEALEGMQSIRDQAKAAETPPVQAGAYTQEKAEVTLSAERRKPYVTVAQLLVASVEDGAVKYEDTFFYKVDYSGVDSLRIDIPAAVAAELTDTPHLHKQRITPDPKDLDKGDVAWSFAGDGELFGEGRLKLQWLDKIEKLTPGKSQKLSLPRLTPRKADRTWGQIVLAKAETIDLADTDDFQGLRSIDPQHDLMPGAGVTNAAEAAEFHGPWSFSKLIRRFDRKDVKQTNVERGLLRMVLTRAGKVTVQALYRVKSAQQRLVIRLPDGGEFDSEPRINGRSVVLESENEQFYVPLVDPNPDQSFLLELRYTVPQYAGRLTAPEFPVDPDVQPIAPAVQKVHLCAFVPEEWTLLSKSGPWTNEFTWSLDDDLNLRPSSRAVANELLTNLGQAEDTFPIDGRPYLFSTLRPSGPLYLTVARRDLVKFLVFLVILGGGLALLPARAGVRALGVAGLIVALVFCGLFWPVLAATVISDVFGAAILVVLVIWIAWFFFRTKGPWRCCRRSTAQPDEPPPPATAPADAPPAGGAAEGGPAHE